MATKTFDIKPSPRKQGNAVHDSGKDMLASRRRRKKAADETAAKLEVLSADKSEGKKDTSSRDEFLEYMTRSPRQEKPFLVFNKKRFALPGFFKKAARLILIIGLAAAAVYASGVVLAKVTVKMKVSREVQEDIFPIRLARANAKIPTTSALVFEDTKKAFNYTQSYPATGKAEATGRASGVITIENKYTNQVMRFVAGTRFSDDKGQVFRTQQAVSIPGYTQKDSTIIAGTVPIEVRADNIGPEGNLAKGTVLRVAAFKGTDKYAMIAGVVRDGFQGGVQGEITVASAEDIQNAKQQVIEYAFNKSKEEVLASLPEGIRVLDRALQLKISKTSVKAAAGDALVSFEASAEGELQIRFFDERAIRQRVESLLGQPAIKNDIVESDLQISYENVSTSFESAEMAMQVRTRRVVEPILDTVKFRQGIAGRTIADLQTELLKLQGLERVDISVWPFWLSRMPTNIDKIKVVLE
jgi:hypothetical protein